MTESTLTHGQTDDAMPLHYSEEETTAEFHTRERLIEVLAQRRQEDLDDLFHIDPSFPDQNPESATLLKEQFLAAKTGLNLGECFDLSLQDPYFGKVHVVRLASTDHLEPNASQRMFREMNDFLNWFRTQGPLASAESADGFISNVIGDDVVHDALDQNQDPGDNEDRLRSDRWMEYEFFNQLDDDGTVREVAVINRIRPFASVDTLIRGEMCSVKLFKETVFTINASLLRELKLFDQLRIGQAGQHPTMSQQAMKQIEGYLYTPAGDEPEVGRHRIHTAIFSAVVPHSLDYSNNEATT